MPPITHAVVAKLVVLATHTATIVSTVLGFFRTLFRSLASSAFAILKDLFSVFHRITIGVITVAMPIVVPAYAGACYPIPSEGLPPVTAFPSLWPFRLC